MLYISVHKVFNMIFLMLRQNKENLVQAWMVTLNQFPVSICFTLFVIGFYVWHESREVNEKDEKGK